MLIDSHCHLYMGTWSKSIGEVLDRAKENCVDKIICPGIDIESSWQSMTLTKMYANIFAAAGIHPHDANVAPADFIDQLKEILFQPNVVAIGEIGLDYYRNFSDVESQREVFTKQLALAKEMDLPVIIHNRNADSDIIHCIREFSPIRGVAHCFSSDLDTAKILISMGLYISFAGNITYKNSKLGEVAKELPLDKLLVETDAPFLSPDPKRGKENEPANVKIIAEKLAEVFELPIETLETATYNNTVKLFNLPNS